MTLVIEATKKSTITTPSGDTTIDNATVTYDAFVELNLEVPGNVTSREYTVSIPFLGLRMLALGLEQAEGDTGTPGEVTVVLHGASVDTTFLLDVGFGLNWVKGGPIVFFNGTKCPITQTIIALRITNLNTSTMLLHVRAGYISSTVEAAESP